MLKLACIALHRRYGFGRERLFTFIEEMSELSTGRTDDPVYWQHIDRLLTETLKMEWDAENYEEMGTDMGIEMTLTESELARAIELCKHMVGLDYKSPYHRHGKAFYKPYRNYYEAPKDGNPILDKLPFAIINKRVGDISVWYELTEQGLAWLGRQLKITIREVK